MEKYISLLVRRFTPPPVVAPFVNGETEVHSIEQFESVNGLLASRTVTRKVAVADQFNGLKCSDFSIDNLSAIGALDSLRKVHLQGDTISSADSVSGSLSDVSFDVLTPELSSAE